MLCPSLPTALKAHNMTATHFLGVHKNKSQLLQLRAEDGHVAKTHNEQDYFREVPELALFPKLAHPIGEEYFHKVFFFFFPAVRGGSINRRITRATTVPGAQNLYQVVDVGQRELLNVREGSCHQCGSCQAGFAEECSNVP